MPMRPFSDELVSLSLTPPRPSPQNGHELVVEIEGKSYWLSDRKATKRKVP